MKHFEVTITKNCIEKKLDYELGKNHNEVAQKLPLKSKRIYNERFREIEKTGTYYRITENCKGGKSFIYEIDELNGHSCGAFKAVYEQLLKPNGLTI